MDESKVKTLAGFLKWNGLSRKEITKGDISNRIKAQKLVYFGRVLGIPLDYDFDLYVYGPYSSALSHDYFEMGEREWARGEIVIPEGISAILIALKEKDDFFLEIAATLHSIRTSNPDASEEDVINAVSNIKFERLMEKKASIDYVKNTFNEIKNLRLI